jgi:peptide/nickel transport system permease protein
MKKKRRSYYKIIFDQFWQKKLSRLGIAIVVLMMLSALFAPFLASKKPYYYVDQDKITFPVLEDVFVLSHFFHYPEYIETDFRKLSQDPNEHLILPPIPYSPTEYNLEQILVKPSFEHLMGTDDQGRDVASRMIHGSQVSLSVGFVAVAIYVVIGLIVGALAGYFGGRTDMIISRIIEIVMCFPTFLLILSVLAFIGTGLINIMIVIGLTSWTGIARLVRGEFLKLKNQDFVSSSRALGVSTIGIMVRHILPNALSPVLVSVTFGIASSILIESSLSFLGFGIQPPTPSWGDVLSQSREFMDIAWWLMLFPGIAIFLTITAFNLVGEGLRDAVDPRSD